MMRCNMLSAVAPHASRTCNLPGRFDWPCLAAALPRFGMHPFSSRLRCSSARSHEKMPTLMSSS